MAKIESLCGIKVLPNIPPKIEETQNAITNLPVSTYKSSNNVEIEKRMKQVILTNSVTTTIEPNISIKLKINFSNKFDYVPFVHYSLICKDELFDMCHHIAEVNESSFTLKIENSSLVPRDVSIIYRAF